MKFFDRFRPAKRPGLRYSDEASHWARDHFPYDKQRREIAAVVTGILCEQTGAQFSELNASTHFWNDMLVFDYFDPVTYSTAIMEEFNLEIPVQSLQKIHRISDLVEYLHENCTSST